MTWPIQNNFKVLLSIFANYRLNPQRFTTSLDIKKKTELDLKTISNNLKILLRKGYITETKNIGIIPNKYLKNLYKMHPFGVEFVNHFIKEFNLNSLTLKDLSQIFNNIKRFFENINVKKMTAVEMIHFLNEIIKVKNGI